MKERDIPKDSAPRREERRSRSTAPGAKSVKLRYGPYNVPGMMVNNSGGEFGMLADVPTIGIEKYVYCPTRLDTHKGPSLTVLGHARLAQSLDTLLG